MIIDKSPHPVLGIPKGKVRKSESWKGGAIREV